ncbi:MAG TPA: carboxypeptidase regulatory-like domain-containing protein, partial [Longimicrobium sp.]
PADSLRRAPRRAGPGRLSGVVTAADGGRPLAGASVSVVDGAPTRTNERGEWTLEDAPSGTRILEVRAPGYHPVRRVVNVMDGERPVRVTMSQVAAMMDTIRAVVRSRANRSLGGFDERRRSRGVGRFLSAEDIEKRRVIVTSELFDMIPGLQRERNAEEGDRFTMRSVFSGADRCVPAVFMNGHRMEGLSASEVDMLVSPKEIAAMEVYTESQSPPQFQSPMGGCGSIVVWTK